jgi:hypothetical protein
MRKPQPEIYDELLRRLDLPQNLPPAAELGMKTVLFSSEPRCRQALRALGAQGS